MRIIDSHLHYGIIDHFNMSEKAVIDTIEKHNIEFGIISTIEAIEYDGKLNLLEDNSERGQIKVNKKMLDIIKRNPEKLIGKFWIKPRTEGFTQEVADFMTENKKYFRGFKMHPYHSQLKITDKRCKDYIEFAKAHSLPVAIHTAGDDMSSPKHVYEIALKYPDVNFILVHLGLGTDNEESIELIQKLPNLYGDSTWVKAEKVLKAIKLCGSDKIMFGTDAPIDENRDTYDFYQAMFELLKIELSEEELNNFYYANAVRLFGNIENKIKLKG